MATNQCKSCGGVYVDVQADGSSYFHACPPLVEYFDDTKLPITRADAQGILLLGGKVYERIVERPNKRDENPDPRVTRAPGGAPMKSPGDGVAAVNRVVDPLAGAVLLDGAAPRP